MKMNDKIYNVLKWVALVALDAFGIAYKGLASVWGWNYGEQVMQTCVILSVLIGTLIGVTSATYNRKVKENNDTIEEKTED